MSICLIDTTIFCNILALPGKSQDHDAVMETLSAHIKEGVTLLLPMATILETGNHIGHIGDGRLRRTAAERFVELVREALQGNTPWTPTPFFQVDELSGWIEEFPNYSDSGMGIGDMSIVKEWERQWQLNKTRHVFIWSLDSDLAGYGSQGA